MRVWSRLGGPQPLFSHYFSRHYPLLLDRNLNEYLERILFLCKVRRSYSYFIFPPTKFKANLILNNEENPVQVYDWKPSTSEDPLCGAFFPACGGGWLLVHSGTTGGGRVLLAFIRSVLSTLYLNFQDSFSLCLLAHSAVRAV